MTQTWANSLDLHLDLSGTRVRPAIEVALRDAIRGGRLAPGARLPSSRALAADLRVARNTVAEVYAQLVAEGWLTARTGSGTAVAPHRDTPRRAAEASDGASRPPRYDLRPGTPDLSGFPRGEWLAAARRALAAAPDHLLGYGDPLGLPRLREELAGYLARTRGVVADPGCVVICSGFTHGLAMIARTLRGGAVAVEAYGHRTHRDILAANGVDVRLMPVDRHGAVPCAADAVLLTPAHQFPLGMALHPSRRRAVTSGNVLVIEDDYDGEFRYDRQPAGALQALAPDSVIYAGTASKSLAPGARLGWLVVPPSLLPALTTVPDGGPSVLDQLTLAELIASGGYDRHIRRARLAYRRRRDRLCDALGRLGYQVTGIAAGMHALVEFDHNEAEWQAAERATARGVAVTGLLEYAAEPEPDRHGLVIGYASPPDHAYTTALARLVAALPRVLPERGRDQRAGCQEAADQGGQFGCRPHGGVHLAGQDRQPRRRAQRAIPVAVPQAPAQQAPELGDVRGGDRVGVAEDEHDRHGERGGFCRPVERDGQEPADLVDQAGPLLRARRHLLVDGVPR